MSLRELTWPSEPTMRDLIDQFPLATVLASRDGSVKFINKEFSRSFDQACIESDGVAQILSSPSAGLRTMRLTRRDGRELDVRVQSFRVADCIVLVVDESHGPDFCPVNHVSCSILEEVHKRIAELERRSSTDALTGVWNRGHLDRIIDSELSRSLRSSQPVSLIFLDVDHFKRINDLLGHQTGDSVLRELVQVISTHIRASDSLFRWGGEEFAVLAPSTGHRACESLAEKLRSAVERHPFSRTASVTISIGVAEYVTPETAENWFGRADTVLYAAKKGGRNRVSVDRRGNSDVWSAQLGSSVLQLTWREAYECGEPMIDDEHRDLFERANAVIAAAISVDTEPGLFIETLETLLGYLVRHFADEEELLAQRGYAHLKSHKQAHAGLLGRAMKLKASAQAGNASLGALVDFFANDLVARHILEMDRDYFPLLAKTTVPDETPAKVLAAHSS